MPKYLLIALFCLAWTSYADEFNPVSLYDPSLPVYWTHAGGGQYVKKPAVKEGTNVLKCVELTGGNISLSVNGYKFPPYLNSPAGRFCRFTVMAKGTGVLEVAIKVAESDEAGRIKSRNSADQKVELSGKWQKIELNTQEKNPRAGSHSVSITLVSGEKARGIDASVTNLCVTDALLTDARFNYYGSPGVEMSLTPPATVAKAGSPVNLKVSLTRDHKPLASMPVKITVFNTLAGLDGKIIETEKNTDASGAINYSFKPANSNDGVRVRAFSMTNGVSSEAYVIFADDAQIKKYEQLAEKVKFNKPVSILIIGDSLSDYARGYNYADILKSYLDKNNPGLVKIRNAAVGGDYIIRVVERLTGIANKKAPASGRYREYMYDGLLAEQPDMLFISLGHNDTRVRSDKNDGKIPLVPPERQYESYNELIAYIREHSPKTKIILMSNTSSYLPVQQELAEKEKVKGKPYGIFGLPEHMEAFNDVLKKLAGENEIDYLDVYSPTKAHPEKINLFDQGGVHLSLKGHQFIAEKLLEYFAAKSVKNK